MFNFSEARGAVGSARSSLNTRHPILAIAPSKTSLDDFLNYPYISVKKLPNEAKKAPDQYIKPLDIISRSIKGENKWGAFHFMVYLGANQFLTYDGDFGTYFVVNDLANADSPITRYHPIIPFKREEDIIRHIAKAFHAQYGKKDSKKSYYDYNLINRNCEHFANRVVLGIDASNQVIRKTENWIELTGRIFDTENELSTSGSSFLDPNFDEMTNSSKDAPSMSTASNAISGFIREARKNQEINQPKFLAQVWVQPKSDCKIQ